MSWVPMPDGSLAVLVRAGLWCGLAALAVWAVCGLLPRLAPRWRAILWCLAAARGLGELLAVPAIELPVLTPAPPASPEFSQLAAALAPITQSAEIASRNDWWWVATGLLTLWVLGATFGLLSWLRAARRFLALLRDSRACVEPQILDCWRSVQERLGSARRPDLRWSETIDSPLACGLIRPVVLLPSAALAWDQRRLQLALAHEVAHHLRYDLWTAWIPAAARWLLWFQPLARWVEREHRLACEQASDQLALAVCQASPREYGRWLVSFAHRSQSMTPPTARLAAPFGPDQLTLLKRRLTMLENVPPRHTPHRATLWLALALTALLLTPIRLGVAEQAAPDPSAARSEQERRGRELPREVAAAPVEPAGDEDPTGEASAPLAEGDALDVNEALELAAAAQALLPVADRQATRRLERLAEQAQHLAELHRDLAARQSRLRAPEPRIERSALRKLERLARKQAAWAERDLAFAHDAAVRARAERDAARQERGLRAVTPEPPAAPSPDQPVGPSWLEVLRQREVADAIAPEFPLAPLAEPSEDAVILY